MGARFSIIIPTLNRCAMLRSALASVRAQNIPDTEVIVVDGGSTDGTLEYIAGLPDIQFIGGPDRGLYDAINKGIAKANGDIIGLLNSDDAYEPGAFAAVTAAFASGADSVCGTATLVEGDRVIAVFDRDSDKLLASPRSILIGTCIPNARFFRRAAMLRIGPFSLDYRFVADRDWLMRWSGAGLRTTTAPERVYRYRQHPGSLTLDSGGAHRIAIRRELLHLARKWRLEPAASPDARRIAHYLEGRCIAALAGAALRQGRIAEAATWLFTRDGRSSLSPLVAVATGGVDWMSETIRRK